MARSIQYRHTGGQPKSRKTVKSEVMQDVVDDVVFDLYSDLGDTPTEEQESDPDIIHSKKRLSKLQKKLDHLSAKEQKKSRKRHGASSLGGQ